MELLMQTPCEDFVTEPEVYEIYTQPDDDFLGTKKMLEDAGYQFLSAEEEMIPSNYSGIQDQENREKMQKLLDMLEDDDDVQNVYHNWDEE